MTDPSPPTKEIGGYRLLRQIGKGGMGTIWRAEHAKTGKVVAVKMLHSHLVGNVTFRKRFVTEARAQARLRHPHIAEVMNLVEQDGEYAIIMEFLPGETLSRKIKRDGPMPPEVALPYFRQILDAVAHAHSLGVLHRDLKPSNVMIDDAGIVKVTDFGTAKILGAETLTLAGTALGSPLYMAPEVLAGDPPSESSEVYALGVSLYQMVTSEPPFEGNSLAELIRKLRSESPPTPREKNPGVPVMLDVIIRKAMARLAEERYPTVLALRAALDGYRTGESTRGTAVELDATPPPTRIDDTPQDAPADAPTDAPAAAGPSDLDTARTTYASARRPGGAPTWIVLVGVPVVAIVLFIAAFSGTFHRGFIAGMLGLLIFGVVWQGLRGGGPRRCVRCGRGQERGWKECLFCAKGIPPPDLEAALVGRTEDGGERRWPLPLGTHAIGRHDPCPVLLEDERASHLHAEIRHEKGLLFLIDLGSTNGTLLNGKRVPEARAIPIYHADVIRIGRTELVVHAQPVGGAQDPPHR